MSMQLGDQGAPGERLSEAGVAAVFEPERRGRPGSRAEERAAYAFLAPWMVGFVLFLLIPLGWAVWLSFTDEQLLRPGQFIGFDNYARAFTTTPPSTRRFR